MNSEQNNIKAPDNVSSDKKRPGAFYIWWHPSRARKIIDNLLTTSDDLRDLLDRSERERRRLADENNLLSERLRIMREENEHDNSRYKQHIARLEKNSDQLQQEIEDWRHTRAELEAMASRLTEWEEMKDDYEKQIKNLTLRLDDALGNFRGRQSAAPSKISISDILDEDDSLYNDPTPKHPRRRTPPPADDTDWLLPLPD